MSNFTDNESAYSYSTFMGARVQNVSASIGLGGQPSQLRVDLVEDEVNDLLFNPPTMGTPAQFELEGFTFEGLLQFKERRLGTDGFPVYSVIVNDPREILDGAQVILSSYTGAINTSLKNLYNVYGYLEKDGFGGSLSNLGGIPWYKVRESLTTLTNTASPYGSPLYFRGNSYSLNLSELPSLSADYRIPGPSVGLLELINQVCEDGGMDFFVDLKGFEIRVRTISRYTQPGLTSLATLTTTGLGTNLIRSSVGQEVRNELTTTFLMGGERHDLYNFSNLRQFWGYNVDGEVIVGSGTLGSAEVFVDGNGVVLDTISCEQMHLNAAPIADIVGSVHYVSNTIEMRMAQANQESWALYVTRQKPAIAALVGMTSPFANGLANLNQAFAGIRGNFVNDAQANAQLAAQAAVATDIQTRQNRLYEFVRGYADEYMGKKYIASLSGVVNWTYDSTTALQVTDHEVSDGGYASESGTPPLYLSPANEDIFRTQDGRIRPFARFDEALDVHFDLSKVSPQGAVFDADENRLFMDVQVDPRFVPFEGYPHALISLQAPVVEEVENTVGDLRLLAAVLKGNEADLKAALKQAVIPIKAAPEVVPPSVAVLALKSNVRTYGPWYASGAPGRVRIEQDSTLSPWNFDGYENMNAAASIRTASAITNQQVSETGFLELAGAPSCSLGDILEEGGPNVTNIDIGFGTNGITTTYRFQTYTPQFGVTSRGVTEKIRQNAMVNARLKQEGRQRGRDLVAKNVAVADAARTRLAFMQNQAKAQKRETPHDVIHSYTESIGGRTKNWISTVTAEEALTMSNADDASKYAHTTIMSLDGIIRPFVGRVATAASGVPRANELATIDAGNAAGLSAFDLTPFKFANDFGAYTNSSYTESDRLINHGSSVSTSPNTSFKGFGLRGPLYVVGWGYDTNGNPVPSGGNGNFENNYLVDQSRWKAGPMDALWDGYRNVWTSHDMAFGYLTGVISALGSGTLQVYGRAPAGAQHSLFPLTVWNPYTVALSGTFAPGIAAYDPYSNKWSLIGVQRSLNVVTDVSCNVNGTITVTKKSLTGLIFDLS